MLCDICQMREAKIFYTEIVNGKKTEQHLCEQCASEHTAFPIGDMGGKQIPIGNILSGILNRYMNDRENDAPETVPGKDSEPVCPECGTTESELLKYGRMGCPVCYSVFADIVNRNFKASQGGTSHCGKEPNFAKRIEIAEPVNVKNGKKLSMLENDGKKKTSGRSANSSRIASKSKPNGKNGNEEQIAELKTELKQAVEQEDYDEAARLRDEIRSLEGKTNEKKEK